LLLLEEYAIDPLLINQWSIENNGYMGGTPGADMKVTEAWNYSTGFGIKVAVFDLGVQLDHPDLIDNLLPGYDATGNGSAGAPGCNNNVCDKHGTLCSGVIAATHNNIGIKGVAYGAKIIPVRIGYKNNPNVSYFISSTNWQVNAFMWAKENGADVISCSWGGGSNISLLDNAITDCVDNGRNGKGITVLFATGNSNNSTISYPASHPKVIAVGASTMCDERKQHSSCDKEDWGSNYGEGMSIVAPGVKIYTTDHNSNYISVSGTSLACPNVAGVVALILSFNPNFTQNQVRNIIESTADKIQPSSYNYQTWGTYPNGTWSHQAGYGRVNATSAIKKVLNCYYVKKPLDLYISDNTEDAGVEPNTNTNFKWNSPNIWLRTNNDNYITHQNPRHSINYPNYIHVKIKNKGCLSSSISDSLELYWSKFATSPSWRNQWDQNAVQVYPLRGEFIEKLKIPIIQPGEEAVIPFKWYNTVNTDDYLQINTNRWQYSFLARIVSKDDPMEYIETESTYENVRNNNNIAQKSLTNISNGILHFYNIPDGVVAIDNYFNNSQNFVLTFMSDSENSEDKIFEVANVYIIFDEVLRTIWINGGKQAYNIVEENDTTLKIIGDNATLNNLNFNAGQYATLNLRVHFLEQYTINNNDYTYHVIQKMTNNNNVVGGVAYKIKDYGSELNYVLAVLDVDVRRDKGDTIFLHNMAYAFIQNDGNNYDYKWYDKNSNLVCDNDTFVVSVDKPTKYTLTITNFEEVVNIIEFRLKLLPNRIETLYANPTTDQVAIHYRINQGEDACLHIGDVYGINDVVRYPITNIDNNQIVIDLTNYTEGMYTVSLVVDGRIEDTKTLIKQ